MSKTIDERVVSMQFDNRNFESNVRTTMSTLEKLKSKLNLLGATKGIDSVNAAAKSCNLSPIGAGVDAVNVKFSKLQAAAAHALGDIAVRAYKTGESVVKSLTIDPITTGFNEYELKMNSIQTIMASTGENLATVNQYLNELNKYSDETIYSFSDMTQNIGKFTNAGIKLEDAVVAIKGIANEAALSGANANEAARAMYNFSQALSTGYVQRIDWKSIELANMATVEFKEQLLEQAVAMGTVTKSAEGMYKAIGDDTYYNTAQMFVEALDEQWLTSEVLIGTLKDYADTTTDIGKRATEAATQVKTFSHMMDTLKESAQSGWAQTWEILFGDFEEGKTLWTNLNKVIGGFIDKMSTKRNDMLADALNSNWEKLIDKITKAGIKSSDFEDRVTDALKKNGKDVGKLIKEYGSLEKIFTSGAASGDILKEVIEGLTSSVDGVTQKLYDLSGIEEKLGFGAIGEDVKKVQTVLEKLGYTLSRFGSDGIIGDETTAAIRKFQTDKGLKVDGIIGPETIKALEEAVAATEELTDENKDLIDSYEDLVDSIDKARGRELFIESWVNLFKKIQPILDSFKEKWNEAFGDMPTLGDVLVDLIDGFANFVDNLDFSGEVMAEINTVIQGFISSLQTLSILGGGLWGWLVKVLKLVGNNLGMNFWDMTVVIANLITKFYQWITSNNALYESLLKLGTSVVTFITSTIDGIINWINEFLKLDSVTKCMETFTKYITIAFASAKQWLEGFGQIFTDFATAISAMDSITFEGLLKAVGDLVSDIAKHFGEIPSLISTALGLAFDKILELVSMFLAKLVGGSDNLEAFVKNFTAIKSAIKSALSPIKTFINKIVQLGTTFSKWMVSLKDAEDLPKAIGEGIGRALGSLVKYIATSIYNFGKALYEGMTGAGSDGVAGLVVGLLKGIPSVLGAILKIAWGLIEGFCSALGIHSPSRVMMGLGAFIVMGLIVGLKQAFPDVWNSISTFCSGIVTAFQDTFAPFVEFLKKIPFGNIIAVGLIGGLLFFIKKLAAMGDRIGESMAIMLESVSGVFNGVAGVIGSFKSMINNVSEAIVNNFKADAFKKRAEGIKSLAIGIGILAAALVALALVDKFGGNLWKVVGVIGAMAGILAAFTAIIAVINRFIGDVSLEFAGVAIGMLGMAVGMTILASAAKKLAEVPADRFWDIVPAMMALMTAMTFVVSIFGNIANPKVAGNINKLGGVFIKIGLAMLMMAYVAKIAGSLDAKEADQAWDAMIAFGTIMGGLVWISQSAGDSINDVGNTILKIGAAFVLLSQAIKVVGKLKPNQVDQAIDVMGKMTLMIIGIVGVLELLSWMGGTGINGGGIGKTLLAVAGAMLMITSAALMLAIVPYDNLRVAGGALAGLTILIMVLIGVLNQINAGNLKGIGATVIMIAGAMMMLAAAALILSAIPWQKMLVAGIAILALGTAIGFFIKFLSGIETKRLTGVGITLLLVSGAIAVLAAMSTVIGLIPLGILAKGVIAIGLLGLMVAEIIKATANATDAKSTLIGLSITLVVLAGALAALSFIPANDLEAATVSLMGVMVALGVLMHMIGSTKIDIKSLAMIAGVIAVLGGIMFLLGQLDAGRAIEAGAALSLSMIAMAGAMAIINKFGTTSGAKKGPNTLKAIATMAGVALVLAGSIAIIGQLDAGAAYEAATALGITMLALAGAMAIINKFGSTTGDKKQDNILKSLLALSIVAGVVGLVLSEIGKLDAGAAFEAATALSLTLLALAGAMAIMSTFGSGGSVGSLLAMSVAILAIGAAMMMLATIPADRIWSVFGVLAASMGVLTVVLVALAAAFTYLAPGAALVVGALLAIAAVAVAVGTAAVLFAAAIDMVSMTLPGLAVGLTMLVMSLASCSDSALAFVGVSLALLVGMTAIGVGLTVLSVGIIAAASAIAIGLLSVATSLTAGIMLLGTGLSVGITSIASALAVGLLLVAAAIAVGLVAASIALTAGVSLLSVGLVIAGAALVVFAAGVLVAAGAIYVMALAIEFLGECISVGLALGIESGKSNVSKAASGLVDSIIGTICSLLGIHSPSWVMQMLGQYTGQGFALGLTDTEGDVDSAATGLADIVKNGLGSAGAEGGNEFNMEALENMDISSLMSGESFNAGSLTSMFGSVGAEGGAAFNMEALSNMDFSSITSNASADMSALPTEFGSMGTETGSAFSMGVRETSSMNPTINDLLGEISKSEPKFKDGGTKAMTAFGEGLKAAANKPKTALRTAVSTMIEAARSARTSFYNAGNYLVEGFAKGISENSYKASAKARAMANAAYNAARIALQVNSPSKVFRELGTSVPEGFAMGIGMLGEMIDHSIDDMSEGAISETRNVISRLSDAINMNIDGQPTIRPVLDLSDVESGASAIGGMFGSSSIGLSTVGTINSMMNHRGQNGGNGDVVSAIDKLRKELGNVGGTSYNINGVTYDRGSELDDAVRTIVRYARIEGRV